ncbi:unnamed protein product, partial [Mesorhabditis belari]|uniref:Peptidase M1 leukotriene A4 hydrolase/aminopeptidase C-terminal domain-containing protein n=1 Tax=Mesorhabditis belari TaxID=2138241 RepID=A0AAF3ECI0_9BILA
MDPASCSNFDEVLPTHYSLNWTVDFDKELIHGNVVIDLKVKKDTSKLVLDGSGLTISKIRFEGNQDELKFSVADYAPFGQKIEVVVPELKADTTSKVRIEYATSSPPSAVQFLSAEQTTDKLAPYLFSQCQAIHARSLMPCMDTPSAKASYDATVSVPAGLTCVMSAVGDKVKEESDRAVFFYEQKIPIPTYLLAIVVGKIVRKDISERCAVWAEPSQIDAAHWEFEETEKILTVAENLAGPYQWGRYDLMVLPSTFPYGGMENPCMTFITPTLLAGDRSLVNVVAHEISHSWTGNLVTNANWEHFWLNEGFTVFLERKIHGRMYGEQARQFESECGWEDNMLPTINKVFGPTHEYTKLLQNQKGVDPDDAFSCIPYEKGSAFLFHLEQTLGDNARFEEFLRAYIAKYAHKSIFTDDWRSTLYEFYKDKTDELNKIDWDQWLTAPGIPPVRPKYDSTLRDMCRRLSEAWLSDSPPTTRDDFEKMISSQKVAVIDVIRANGKMSEDKFSWLMMGIENQWTPSVVPALAWVLTVGRLKYCKPIYKALFEWPFSKTRAIDQFKANISHMHPITASIISKLLPK